MTNDPLNEKSIQWSCDYLLTHGYTLKNNQPENVKNTPWSYVARFTTSEGYIYLKQTPNLIALEATIIQILQDQFHASVPTVLAHNTELNCFLMKDAGSVLRGILKNKFDVTLLCKAIDQFTLLQIATMDNVAVFFDVGVPDWRLDKLPDLYKSLLLQRELLVEDGLSETEICKLEALYPKVTNLCNTLSEHSIKPSVVQPDFNDNNTLIDAVSHAITIIDVGEIVISHPFFSLINCLHQVKKHYGLTEEDETYVRITNACFKNYLTFGSKKELFDAYSLAYELWNVYGALAQYRLMIACGTDKLMMFQPGRLSDSLKELLV